MAEMFANIARVCATVLADSLVQGTAIAVMAFALVNILRNSDARSRFSVLLGAMLTLALLPCLRLVRTVNGSSDAAASLFRIAESWIPWIVLVWAICASMALLRVATGVLKLRRIRSRCAELPPEELGEEVAEAIRDSAGPRRVRVLVSAEVTVPSAIGFFRPAILLPRWVVEELPESELKHVVIHELSHLRRWDDWTNLAQKIVKALFFFHPAIWWMESRLSFEREAACDDAVLRSAADPKAYAQCLAHLAERSFLRRGLAMAQAAVSKVRQTSRRVARILSVGSTTAKPFGKYAASAAGVVAVGFVAILWTAPETVSFSSQVAVTSASYVARPTIAVPQPINAAWHETRTVPQVVSLKSEQKERKPARAARKMVVARHAPPDPQWFQTVAANHQVVTSSFVLVVQDEGQIAVWHVTTWQYQPSRVVRASQKTT